MEILIIILTVTAVTPLLIFWGYMINDLVRRNDIPDKQMWFVIVVFGSVFGAFYYFLNMYEKRNK